MSSNGSVGREEGRWPTGHLAWFFDGIGEFEGAATTFLAEGAARGERLMVVADDPRPDLWPQALIERGDLIVASTTETYGPERQVVAETQRHTFEAALAEARALGYSGLRIAADNTSLISGPERLEAWKDWESVADRFMAENPEPSPGLHGRHAAETSRRLGGRLTPAPFGWCRYGREPVASARGWD